MPTLFATLFVNALELYACVGLVFALYFAFFGCKRLDPSAKHGTLGFRLLILPGSAALWPLLLMRLLRGQTQPPIERNSHRDRAEKAP